MFAKFHCLPKGQLIILEIHQILYWIISYLFLQFLFHSRTNNSWLVNPNFKCARWCQLSWENLQYKSISCTECKLLKSFIYIQSRIWKTSKMPDFQLFKKTFCPHMTHTSQKYTCNTEVYLYYNVELIILIWRIQTFDPCGKVFQLSSLYNSACDALNVWWWVCLPTNDIDY